MARKKQVAGGLVVLLLLSALGQEAAVLTITFSPPQPTANCFNPTNPAVRFPQPNQKEFLTQPTPETRTNSTFHSGPCSKVPCYEEPPTRRDAWSAVWTPKSEVRRMFHALDACGPPVLSK